jgi:hypothetical protein
MTTISAVMAGRVPATHAPKGGTTPSVVTATHPVMARLDRAIPDAEPCQCLV